MKKYTDWQKYVREQSDKLGGQQKGKTEAGTRPADGHLISRVQKTEKQAQSLPPPTRVPKPTSPERRVVVKRDIPRPEPESIEPAAKPQASLSAPFVSVHDVWKAAEKSGRGVPARPREAAPPARQQQAKLPGMEAESSTSVSAMQGTPKKTSDETREEILERLVNPTVSLEEAAKIMGVCKATVRRYTAKGILPHYRTPGNQRRFKLNDIIQFLERQRR